MSIMNVEFDVLQRRQAVSQAIRLAVDGQKSASMIGWTSRDLLR
jgi:hypothetical protein